MKLCLRDLNICLLLTLVISLGSATNAANPKLTPALQALVDEGVPADSMVSVILLLDDTDSRYELAQIEFSPKLTRAARISQVSEQLRSFRPAAADQVEQFLDSRASGKYRKHWIIPAYSAMIPLSAIEELAAIEGVSLIAPNAEITYDPPVMSSASPSFVTGVSDHLKLMNVPSVWNKGYTGAGRLVCSFDTGVEESHPALSAKWQGRNSTLEASWFSTVKPDSLPFDKVGHGTHTMGVMVGSDGADTVGVAPGAKWISAGVIDQGKSLGATFDDILAAFEWALNPDGDFSTTNDVPDVILNSWGVPKGMFNPCDDLFWGVIDNVEAAGIVTIFAAGNEGPDPMTVRSPADRSSTPFNTFSVGAVDLNKVVADFSSRGPSSCNLNKVKPEVMAPGVGVRSATKGGGYLVMSGTSMAAPYIAGLVALARQYNPDATPIEIKQAMIAAAEDLGPVGEDNAYGYGFVDADRMIENLPKPLINKYIVDEINILNDAELNPGSQVELQLVLRNDAGIPDNVYGRMLIGADEGVYLTVARVPFIGNPGGTEIFNLEPFAIEIESVVAHGTVLGFTLQIENSNGTILESTELKLTVGTTPPGDLVNFANGSISMTISDFGQLGLGSGSIYNAGGEGFRFNGSENLLYEAGIMIGRIGRDISSSVRSESGAFRPSDFSPIEEISTEWFGGDDGYHTEAVFSDQSGDNPLPLEIHFESIDYSRLADEAAVLLTYKLVNVGTADLDSIFFGFSTDFDLPGPSESVSYLDSLKMVYQASSEGPLVGIVMLEQLVSVTTIVNGSDKAGLSQSDMLRVISEAQMRLEHPVADDLYLVIGSPSLDLAVGDSVTIRLAMVAGDDLDELKLNAGKVIERFNKGNTGGTNVNLPESFELHQNYPNPFNPATTIGFTTLQAGSFEIEIFNSLGQTVKAINTGQLTAGYHEVIWAGDNHSGSSVASGVYFYRVSGMGNRKVRKMVLLK